MITRSYYILKPFIPRKLQIAVRRWAIRRQLPKVAAVWPINKQAGGIPAGWKGWPEGKKFAIILTHDVDTQRGHDRCEDLAALETEMGFRSSFNFVPERYTVSQKLRNLLTSSGFEVGVHGLKHDGKYFDNRNIFRDRANRINQYIREWGAAGYRSPSMLHKLDWIHDLEITYDASTFDIDPFEPDPTGVGTIFPFRVTTKTFVKGYVELPYTLPQDFTLYILMGCRNIDLWKSKLKWIAEQGGMALLNTHPDYMNFHGGKNGTEEYPSKYYSDFLRYIVSEYKGNYWSVLPKELAIKIESGDISVDTIDSSSFYNKV